MARRSKLTATTVEKICDAIAIGATNRIAGLYARVSEATILGWQKAAREENERRDEGQEPRHELDKYVEFLRKYERAEGQAYIGWLQVIDNAAQNNPQWASYMLERRDRSYSARQEVDVTSGGEPISFIEIVRDATDAHPGTDDESE